MMRTALVALFLVFLPSSAKAVCIGVWQTVAQYSCVTESFVEIDGSDVTKYRPVGFRVDVCKYSNDYDITFGQNFSLLLGLSYSTYEKDHVSFFRGKDDWAFGQTRSTISFRDMVFNYSDIDYGYSRVRSLTALCEPL